MNGLVRRAIDVNHQLLALGNETFEAAGGVFVRNTDVPRIYDGDHVARVTASTPVIVLPTAGSMAPACSDRRPLG